MEALTASYRVLSASVVVVLGATALLATFINAVVAVSFFHPEQSGFTWLTTYAVIYLVLAVAVPAAAAYRSSRRGKTRFELVRRVVFASLALNLLVAPLSIGALSM